MRARGRWPTRGSEMFRHGVVIVAASACAPPPAPRAFAAPTVSAPGAAPVRPDTRTPLAPEPAAPEPTPPERILPPELETAFRPDVVERLAIARGICAAAVHRGPHGKVEVGCRTCPPFGPENGPDGKVILDPPERYPLEAVYRGAFIAPGLNQVAAVFTGCEPHAYNYGGTLLLEEKQGTWATLSYRTGFHPDRCVPFQQTSGVSRLACRTSTTHQGTTHESLVVYDFTREGGDGDPDDPAYSPVLDLTDDTYSRCLDAEDEPHLVSAASIRDFVVSGSGARTTLTATVVGSYGPKTPSFRAECARFAANAAAPLDLAGALGASPTVLRFEWRKDRFTPDTQSRRWIDARNAALNADP